MPHHHCIFGLFTTTPDLAGSGTEVSGGSYARKEITNAQWTGPSGGNREFSNTVVITFDVPTANWGTIRGIALFDDPDAGNMYYVADLTTPKTVNDGDGAPKILANQLRISRSTC